MKNALRAAIAAALLTACGARQERVEETDTSAPDVVAPSDEHTPDAGEDTADPVDEVADTADVPPAPLRAQYEIADEEAYPEAVTFDPVQRAFFTGSLARGNVLRIEADGTEHEHFAGNDDGQHWLVLGVEADPERRRLWACAALTPQLTSSEIWVLDLDTGARQWRQSLEDVHAGAACTDMIVAPDGTAYVCDRENPNIYHLDPDTEEATLLVTDPALGGAIGQNGIAFTPDGQHLLTIIFAPGKLMRIQIAPPHEIVEIPLTGVDERIGLDAMVVLDGEAYLVRDDTIIRATPNADWTAAAASALPLVSGGFSGLTVAEGALYASRSDVTRYALGLAPNLPFLLTRVEPNDF